MPKTYKRSRRISDLVQREIGSILRKEIHDPRLLHLAIIDVNITDDLHLAKVYYAVLDPAKLADVKAALAKAIGFLRHHLAKNLKLRYVPQVQFIYDDSTVRAQRISNLLDQVLPEDENSEENNN